MGECEWTNESVIRLVQEYQARPALWDTSHEAYRVHTLKYRTWRSLADEFGCDISDLRKKLNSLFASHRREKARVRQGAKSTWFLYPYLSFLPSHVDDSGNDLPVRGKKKILQVKQSVTTSEEEGEEEYLEDVDHVEEEVSPEEVRVKREPAASRGYSKPRPKIHHKPRLRPTKKRLVKEYSTADHLDSRLSEALRLLRRSDGMARRKDECDSFGEYIADSLRKHDERTQSMIKQAINNILFEQEMKRYSNANQQYTVVISGMDENPLVLEANDK